MVWCQETQSQLAVFEWPDKVKSSIHQLSFSVFIKIFKLETSRCTSTFVWDLVTQQQKDFLVILCCLVKANRFSGCKICWLHNPYLVVLSCLLIFTFVITFIHYDESSLCCHKCWQFLNPEKPNCKPTFTKKLSVGDRKSTIK